MRHHGHVILAFIHLVNQDAKRLIDLDVGIEVDADVSCSILEDIEPDCIAFVKSAKAVKALVIDDIPCLAFKLQVICHKNVFCIRVFLDDFMHNLIVVDDVA